MIKGQGLLLIIILKRSRLAGFFSTAQKNESWNLPASDR
jgi:hypothetical protein